MLVMVDFQIQKSHLVCKHRNQPFLCRMPFLPQPSHFILACDRHQICWLAYPVAWL